VAQALLRKGLIDSLGMERARGLLTRMGYASGLRDAELARTRAEDCSDIEAFMTGPKLHTLEGIVPSRGQARTHRAASSAAKVPGKPWEANSIAITAFVTGVLDSIITRGSAFMGRAILQGAGASVGQASCRIVSKPARNGPTRPRHALSSPDGRGPVDRRQTQVVQLRSRTALAAAGRHARRSPALPPPTT
jgi:hypothetical protein